MTALMNLSVRQSIREERVSGLLSAIKADIFDSTRYESTPRLRAERIAQILTRSISRSSLRRRLKRLGVEKEFLSGKLSALSVEGGGVDVFRNGKGQVLTGPGIDRQLLEVFPELLPLTLVNSTYQIPPHASDADISVSNPATSGSNALVMNLSIYGVQNLASAAVARYIVSGTGLGMGGSFGAPTVTDPFGSQGGGTVYPQNVDVTWNAAGVNWIEIYSGQNAVSPGSKAVSFSTTYTSWTVGLSFEYCTVTYTTPPCLTCEIVVECEDACSGAAVGGAVFTLSNGLTCSTNGSGECTISNIPDGNYTYTLVKTGYISEGGSFSCVCLTGGQTVLSFILERVGGCKPPPDPTDEDTTGVRSILQWFADQWKYWYVSTSARGTGGDDGHLCARCVTLPVSASDCVELPSGAAECPTLPTGNSTQAELPCEDH